MKSLYTLIIFALVLSCKTPSQPQDAIPEHETFTLDSKHTHDTRVINVWTPPQYADSSAHFPVLYMPDGGLKEDFPHIANTLAELVAANKIPPVILVGIENTERRRDLSGPTEVKEDKEIAPVVGGSANFRAFITNELFAEINKRYRNTPEKGIIGESLAGLFVVETFLLHPETFDFYIAFDPSLWWNNQALLKNSKDLLAEFPQDQEKKIWFAGSKAGDIYQATQDLAETLRSQNLSNIKWQYSPEPKEEHHTIFRATKEKALEWTLGKK